VTCGEHQHAAEEVARWLAELRGEPAGESEEGLWLLVSGAEMPERIEDLARVAALAPAAPLGRDGPFEALEASLSGDAGASEARALLAERSLDARRVLERVLWDGFRSGPGRATLLAVLAEEAPAHAAARELLVACARQAADAELQVAALEVWPRGLGCDALVHVLRWSPRPELVARARQLLARERPEAPELHVNPAFDAR
jgi:hypothetical protein